ncbi:velvet factor-domain-containing protein [Radiomyces spectabilis]|uniref:velvet factor-domain-containing protein n=1 Tax=Radiomyces spectabilis TaxID=64574 RepID=UPI0022211022|nr:velvet factor-domain-containing protein [Radiomyces spectabilis]KAI8390955.1 velvet factor-domain-containing protein [Radiomyces spectabilis]
MNNCIPPPLGLSRPSRGDTRYRLVVVQQPIRARSCGFGEKDRRLVDPPPILQLFAEQDTGEIVKVKPRASESMLFLVQCELYCERQIENRTVVYTPGCVPPSESSGSLKGVISLRKPQYVRNLTGSVISNAYHLFNEKNEMGVYFIFHDLSVRTEGRFTLKFMFIDLAAGEPLTMSTQVQTEVCSDIFVVYSAKKFPGMTESTELSKCFARQGIKIAIRKESSYKRSADRYYQMPVKVAQKSKDDKNDDDRSEEIEDRFYTSAYPSSSSSSSVPPSSSSSMPYTRLSIANVLSPVDDE